MRYYSFSDNPTKEELRELVEQHHNHYHDYCRVWYDDGRKESFINDIPDVYYSVYGKEWRVRFYSKELICNSLSFIARGIIRSKRIIEKKA